METQSSTYTRSSLYSVLLVCFYVSNEARTRPNIRQAFPRPPLPALAKPDVCWHMPIVHLQSRCATRSNARCPISNPTPAWFQCAFNDCIPGFPAPISRTRKRRVRRKNSLGTSVTRTSTFVRFGSIISLREVSSTVRKCPCIEEQPITLCIRLA